MIQIGTNKPFQGDAIRIVHTCPFPNGRLINGLMNECIGLFNDWNACDLKYFLRSEVTTVFFKSVVLCVFGFF